MRARFVQNLTALNGGAPEAYIGATYNYFPGPPVSFSWNWVDGTPPGNLRADYRGLWSGRLAYSSTAFIPTG